jgi:hypothetical protein
VLHGLAFNGAGLFHGGTRTVLYSGESALDAARVAKGTGRLIEDTLGGKVLNMIDQYVPVPESVWKGASAVFSANAKGEVPVFLANPRPEGIWNTVEKPILGVVNKFHNAVTGSPATMVVVK